MRPRTCCCGGSASISNQEVAPTHALRIHPGQILTCRIGDENEAAGAADAARADGPTVVQIPGALAWKNQSGLGSAAEMRLTSDLSQALPGLGYCGYQSGIQIP